MCHDDPILGHLYRCVFGLVGQIDAPLRLSKALDDRSRKTFALIEGELAQGYRLLTGLSLSLFSSSTSADETISFSIVEENFEPVLAIEFFDIGYSDGLRRLKDVSFPTLRIDGSDSISSLRLKLKTVDLKLIQRHSKIGASGSSEPQQCPNCSGDMSYKAPKVGKNPGKRFWLCSAYPKCRGIVQE